MVMASNDLLGAVLELPTKERARIAHELLLSLDEQGDETIDEHEWLAELDRRRQQAESGEIEMLDRAGFHQAIARRRAARRSP
jgi:putative addiction module component (TIGR02574 family)